MCEVWSEAWVEDRARGEYRFNSLMKQKKIEEIASFASSVKRP